MRLTAACALECVHCYSLVHDDLPAMDDDAVRRGRPTLHIAFDEATAILAGDALLTLAFEILSDPSTHADPAIRAELVLLLAKAGGWQGMALGQALDLSPGRQGFSAADIATHAGAQDRRPVPLRLRGGRRARARLAGRARGAHRLCLGSFGQAFQLADDLLDAQGDAAGARQGGGQGRSPRQGHAGGAAWGRRRQGDGWRRLLHEAEAALAPFGDRADTLIEAVPLRR